jgi:hypothetical protein
MLMTVASVIQGDAEAYVNGVENREVVTEGECLREYAP